MIWGSSLLGPPAALPEHDPRSFRPDGSRRPVEEALRFDGERRRWLLQLDEELSRRIEGPPPLTVPPSVFISYRWSTPENDRWVAQLAAELQRRGYTVTFDQDAQAEAEPPTVPRLVSRIAEARVFLAVIDPGYVERVGSQEAAANGTLRIEEGWVVDEYHTAMALSRAKRLRVIGLQRTDCPLPRGFRFPTQTQRGNLHHAEAPQRLAKQLDRHFPPVDPVAATDVERLRDLIGRSHAAIQAARFEAAADLARQAGDLMPGHADGLAQRARVGVAAALPRDTRDAALAAAELQDGDPEMLGWAAAASYELGEVEHAVQLARQAIEIYPRDALPHQVIARTLVNRGQSLSALAHLELAVQERPLQWTLHHDLGRLLRQLGRPREALRRLEDGLAVLPGQAELLADAAASRDPVLAPSRPSRRPAGSIRCDACPCCIPAESDEALLCASCGAVYSKPVPRRCPTCPEYGFVFVALALSGIECRCPFCNMGILSWDAAAD